MILERVRTADPRLLRISRRVPLKVVQPAASATDTICAIDEEPPFQHADDAPMGSSNRGGLARQRLALSVTQRSPDGDRRNLALVASPPGPPGRPPARTRRSQRERPRGGRAGAIGNGHADTARLAAETLMAGSPAPPRSPGCLRWRPGSPRLRRSPSLRRWRWPRPPQLARPSSRSPRRPPRSPDARRARRTSPAGG